MKSLFLSIWNWWIHTPEVLGHHISRWIFTSLRTFRTGQKRWYRNLNICFSWSCFSMSHLIPNRMKIELFSVSFSCFSLFSTWNNLFWSSPLMFYSFLPHTHGQTQFLHSTTVNQSTYRDGRFYISSLCSEQLRSSRIKLGWFLKGLSSAGGDNLLLLMYSYSNGETII